MFLSPRNLKGLQASRSIERHNLQSVMIIWVMSSGFLGILVIHVRPPGYSTTGYSSFYVIVTFKVLSDTLDTIMEFTPKYSWTFFLFCF